MLYHLLNLSMVIWVCLEIGLPHFFGFLTIAILSGPSWSQIRLPLDLAIVGWHQLVVTLAATQDSLRKEVLRPLKMSNKRGSKGGMGLAMNEAMGVACNRCWLRVAGYGRDLACTALGKLLEFWRLQCGCDDFP